jgi:hypothetical protein
MDGLPWPTILGYGSGWAAFTTLALLMARKVANGDWIPRVTHEREINRAEHDANEWRTEGRIKDQATLVELETIKATTEQTGKGVHSLIAGVQKAGGITEGSP